MKKFTFAAIALAFGIVTSAQAQVPPTGKPTVPQGVAPQVAPAPAGQAGAPVAMPRPGPNFKEVTREEWLKAAAERFDAMDLDKNGKASVVEQQTHFEAFRARSMAAQAGSQAGVQGAGKPAVGGTAPNPVKR